MAPGKGLTFESGKLTASGKIGNKITGLRKGHEKGFNTHSPHRHVAQWESASLTRKRSAVQSRPCLPLSEKLLRVSAFVDHFNETDTNKTARR